MRQTILIVTAAGLGKRIKEYSLKKYGKYVDKPLVELKNKKLLEWSIKPFYPLITSGILKFENVFVVIRSDQDEKSFKEVCQIINPKIKVIAIDKLSKGPAHTTYEACKKISNKQNIQEFTILVSDSDHTFRSDNLLNFFRDSNRVNFNSYCVLREVDNPDKWGYVIKNQNGSYTSGEKDILSKSILERENAEFLIGCYVYHDLLSLQRGINLFENSENKNKESHHSLILSLLSKVSEVDSISSNWGMGLGTPLQLEEAERSIISFSGNREPSTFVIDIDGVIFEHDAGRFSPAGDFDENPNGIMENIISINNLKENGALIILLSSRPECLYSKTKNDLDKFGVKFDKLILGATSGIRYLINDRKPSNPALNTSISINSERNKKFEVDHTGEIDFIKDCTKGSGASTLILRSEKKDFSFVRKWTESSNEDISKTLYKQFSYLKIMHQYINDAIPEILDWNFSKNGISYYDMSFINGTSLSIEDITNSPVIVSNLCNVLSRLYETSSKGKGLSYNSLLRKIIKTKLKPTIKSSISQLNQLINKFDAVMSLNLETKLNESINCLELNNTLWQSHNSNLIHGDLTLENIFRKNDHIYLIDPLGSTMDVNAYGSMKQVTSSIFDLGKLFQSLISQYETWAYLNVESISTYIRNFSLEEEKRNINEILTSINPIIDFYGEYINGNILNDGLFSLAQILIRVCPYRIRANYNHSALVCLLKAYAIINYLEEI